MSARNLMLILSALLIASGTAYFARNWMAAERAQIAATVPPHPPEPAHAVLVAKTDLPAGLFVRKEHLRWQAWPDETLDPNYLIEGRHDPQAVIGGVVRRGIFAGQPVTPAQIAHPGDRGFLAAVLKPGMRAVSIRVSETTGISGLVLPGDRVDVILTHAISRAEGLAERESRASETILENVRVLAIDQVLNDQESEPRLAETATLEVTPRQVELVALASELGRLSLSLRSLGRPELMSGSPLLPAADTAAADGTVLARDPIAAITEIPNPSRGRSYTRDSDVSRLIGGSGRKVQVFNGSAVTEIVVH